MNNRNGASVDFLTCPGGASVDFLTSRREVKKSTLAPMLLLLLAACSKAPPETPAAPPTPRGETPVIIYLIDTLRADRLGLYGYDKPTSPTIDALARESVVFDHAYSAAPWTLPSVASLVTSRPACEHGVIRTRLKLAPEIPTLAQHAQDLGYATGAFIRNKLAGSVADLNRGYQISAFTKPMDPGFSGQVDKFLQQNGSGPFLLYVHTMEPHTLFGSPPEHIRKFGFVSVDDRETFRARYDSYRLLWYADFANMRSPGTTDTTADIARLSRDLLQTRPDIEVLYDAAVSYADAQLAVTIESLRRLGIWDRAIFIVIADHGEELYDHSGWFHDHTAYEELLHVPMVVHFPQGAHGGTRIRKQVSLLDIMPTILDYLGRPDLCRDCRGNSLLPLLAHTSDAQYQSTATPSMRHNVGGYFRPLKESKGDINIVVREGPLKAIWNAEPNGVELYDLDNDPKEQRDISESRPEVAAAMSATARHWLEACRSTAIKPLEVPREEMTEETRQELRAHGYFGG